MAAKTQQQMISLQDLVGAPSNGFGYLCHMVRQVNFWSHTQDPYMALRTLDELVVKQANELGFTVRQLQHFVDSKAGRDMGDSLTTVCYEMDTGYLFNAEMIMYKTMSVYLIDMRHG